MNPSLRPAAQVLTEHPIPVKGGAWVIIGSVWIGILLYFAPSLFVLMTAAPHAWQSACVGLWASIFGNLTARDPKGLILAARATGGAFVGGQISGGASISNGPWGSIGGEVALGLGGGAGIGGVIPIWNW